MHDTVRKVIALPEFKRQSFDAVIDKPETITPVAALIRSKRRKHVAEKAEDEDRCWQFLEAGTKTDTYPPSSGSEESDQPPTELSNYKKIPRAYSIQQFQLD